MPLRIWDGNHPVRLFRSFTNASHSINKASANTLCRIPDPFTFFQMRVYMIYTPEEIPSGSIVYLVPLQPDGNGSEISVVGVIVIITFAEVKKKGWEIRRVDYGNMISAVL